MVANKCGCKLQVLFSPVRFIFCTMFNSSGVTHMKTLLLNQTKSQYCHTPPQNGHSFSLSIASPQWVPQAQISGVNYLKIFTHVIHNFHHHFLVNDQWGIWSWKKGLKWSNKFYLLSVSMLPWLMPDSLGAKSKSCYTSSVPWRELLYHTVSSRERGSHG